MSTMSPLTPLVEICRFGNSTVISCISCQFAAVLRLYNNVNASQTYELLERKKKKKTREVANQIFVVFFFSNTFFPHSSTFSEKKKKDKERRRERGRGREGGKRNTRKHIHRR